eukprot:3526386-Amphidinium_carterae.1
MNDNFDSSEAVAKLQQAEMDKLWISDMKYFRTDVKFVLRSQQGVCCHSALSEGISMEWRMRENRATMQQDADDGSKGACGEAERYARTPSTSHAKMTMMRQEHAVAASIGPSGSDLCKSVSAAAAQMTPVIPVVGISCTATSLSNKVHTWYK